MTSVKKTLLLSVCANPCHTLPTRHKKIKDFSSFWLSDIPLVFPPNVWYPDVCAVWWVKGSSWLLSWELTRSRYAEPEHMCYSLLPNSGISTPFLYYLFVFSQGLETRRSGNSADDVTCTHLSHSATSNFKGVDRKQNMYYEKDCRQWITSCQLERKKKLTKMQPKRLQYCGSFALLSSGEGLAGRSGGGIWKATFCAVYHWPEYMIRPRVNKGTNEDQSQLLPHQSGYHGSLTKWSTSNIQIPFWFWLFCVKLGYRGEKKTPYSLQILTACLCYGFYRESFLTTFPPTAGLRLLQFSAAAKLNNQKGGKKSTKCEMKSFSCLPKTHLANKRPSLPFKTLQNLFKPRNFAHKRIHTSRKTCCHKVFPY